MARSEARIFTSIWKDEDFLALPPSAQRLYMFLLSQEDLTYCGAVPLRIPRWVRKAAGLTAADLEQDLKALETAGRQFVITDDETGELLIRSFMRNDEVWKQPNLMKAARSAASQVESETIRAAILAELHRIPASSSSSKLVREVHAEFVRDFSEGSRNPSANPSGNSSPTASTDITAGQNNSGNPSANPFPKGSANPNPDPSADPSPNPTADPSQEKGDGYGLNQGDLLNPVPPELLPTGVARKGFAKGSANPSAKGSDLNVSHVVAAYVEGAAEAGLDTPGSPLKGRVGRQARELLRDGKPIDKLIAAARHMGAVGWDDLARQLQRDSVKGGQQNNSESTSTSRARQAVEAGRQAQALITGGQE